MHKLIHKLTDRVATKKGAWITIGIWLITVIVLSLFSPSSKEYSVNNVSQLYPNTSPSQIAQDKFDTYFKDDDGLPGILVFEAKDDTVDMAQLISFSEAIQQADIPYVKSMIPLQHLPEEALGTFASEDETAAFLPIVFDSGITSKEINVALDEVLPLANEHTDLNVHVTGPAGIAVDATALFSRADLVLLFSTVGIILILLIVTYRSPLLAFIPLLAAIFVYAVVDRILGLVGLSGVELANQSLSIMMILLFAVVIDYSLFIFSRFREELKSNENKYRAMQKAMRGIGIPIFYSGSTIFLAMVTLFLASFGDYRNFAPIFTVTVLIVMLASLTFIPALFTIFGRPSFWPKIPRVGDKDIRPSSLWGRVGRFVAKKPVVSAASILVLLIICSSYVFNITFEYNTMKSFPEDMPSREGYHVLEEKFEKGTLAPTTAIFESKEQLTEDDQKNLINELSNNKLISSVRLTNLTEDEHVAQFDITFSEDPYDVTVINVLEDMIYHSKEITSEADLNGHLYFTGETAASVDNRTVNKRDLIVIVIAETILIFTMLIFLTRSVSISSIMMGTILFSFVAALGLGAFLSSYIFGVDAISNRVPVYAFVFLVALGIDYNIFLVSRFLEEKKHHLVKEAVAVSVAHTGGVISSAGVILAATFAVLITQPVQDLMIFGFIVAIGIIIDTFLIRGVLLPSLLVLLKKNDLPHLLK